MDEHDILDLAAKAQIITKGIEYGVMVQDIDTLRKAVMDLQQCAVILDEIVEDDFGE